MRTSNLVLGHRWLIGAAFSSSLVLGAFAMSGCTAGMQGDPGVTGQAGPQGVAGPAGATGTSGSTGNMGANGNNGANGADGITPSRRALFGPISIGMGSNTGTSTNLLSAFTNGNFTFTTPATTAANSEAVITTAGFCQMSADSTPAPGGDSTVVIQPTITGATSNQTAQTEVNGVFPGSFSQGFTTVTVLSPVTANTQYTVTLTATKTTTSTMGTMLSDECTGNITAQIFAQEMAP